MSIYILCQSISLTVRRYLGQVYKLRKTTFILLHLEFQLTTSLLGFYCLYDAKPLRGSWGMVVQMCPY